MTLHTEDIANAHQELARGTRMRSIRRARRRRGIAALSVRVAGTPGLNAVHGGQNTYEEIL